MTNIGKHPLSVSVPPELANRRFYNSYNFYNFYNQGYSTN